MIRTFSFFLLLILLNCLTGQAQTTGNFEFNKNAETIGITGDTSQRYKDIIFKFGSSFNNSQIGIFTADKKMIAVFDKKSMGKGKDIQLNEDNVYLLIITSDHKVKDCDDCTDEVPNDFTLKLNNKFYGPFHLTQKETSEESVVTTRESNKTSYHSGYILYDAIYINDNWKTGNRRDTIKFILRNYGIDNSADLYKNSYLKAVLGGIYTKEIEGGGGGISPASLLSAVGGLDVTNIADGFARFIVKRTKQELSIAFFDKFNQELNKYPDLKTLFPQTCRTLGVIGDEIYNYEAYIQTLRESFEKDLATLPSNLPAILENHHDFFESTPELKELKAGLLSAFYIAQAVQDRQNPGQIIEDFPVDIWNDVNDMNIKSALQSLQLLSTSLKNNMGNDNYWAPFTAIQELFGDDQLLKIYLGLVEQKAMMDKISFKDKNGRSVTLAAIIDSSYKEVNINLPKYKTWIKNLAFRIQSLQIKIQALKKISNDSILFENYYGVISGSIDLMKYLTEIETLPHFPGGLNIRKKTVICFNLAQTACDIVIDISRRNYSSALVNCIQLYNEIFSKTNITAYALVTKGNAADSIKKSEKISNALLRYGSFMATVVQAKSSDDVEAAIEAFALPTGSARIKRETSFNVALNAYCGLFLGYERIKGIDLGWTGHFNCWGVTAPVGITISRGHSVLFCIPTGKAGWSSSVFLSVIDLGAVAAFRFTDDSTKSIPTIQLEDIVSPGIFYSQGIPKTPLSVNIGWQVGPLLRGVTAKVNNYSSKYSRLSISLCVDIPVLNFYSKPKY